MSSAITRRHFLVGAGATVGAMLTGCAVQLTETPSPVASPSLRPTITPAPPPTPSPTPGASPMPLRQRAAGLLVVGFHGRSLAADEPVLRAIAEDRLGGVILFAENIASPDQLAELTGSLQEAAADRRLLICVDQEGGRVARLGPRNGFPSTVSEAQIGRDDSVDAARRIGGQTASTLKGVGINLNLAPVVDLNVNPANPSIGALGRSFSADPDIVVAMAGAIIDAHRAAGVLTAIKHFPGLGSATGDTDREFVDVTDTWRATELEPFRRLLEAGQVDMVMVANALNGQLDRRYPATLSADTLALLRSDLGWDGVVITDDLQAGALRDGFSDEEIVRRTLAAGNDLLLFANRVAHPSDPGATLDLILQLVDRGFIDEGRIDQAFARVNRLVDGRA